MTLVILYVFRQVVKAILRVVTYITVKSSASLPLLTDPLRYVFSIKEVMSI